MKGESGIEPFLMNRFEHILSEKQEGWVKTSYPLTLTMKGKKGVLKAIHKERLYATLPLHRNRITILPTITLHHLHSNLSDEMMQNGIFQVTAVPTHSYHEEMSSPESL